MTSLSKEKQAINPDIPVMVSCFQETPEVRLLTTTWDPPTTARVVPVVRAVRAVRAVLGGPTRTRAPTGGTTSRGDEDPRILRGARTSRGAEERRVGGRERTRATRVEEEEEGGVEGAGATRGSPATEQSSEGAGT